MKKALTIALATALATGGIMAQAYEQGDWVLRVGATTVDPDTDSDDIPLPDGMTVAQADVDDDTQLGIIPMYMVTDKFGVELLAATPFEHDIDADVRGSSLSVPAGSTKQLPPTLMVQWYPRGGQDGWQPYFGIGLNYTVFFDEDVDKKLIETLDALTPPELIIDDADLDLDDSFGLAAQAGVDIPFSDRWAVNIGIWYIDIDTEAEITAKSGGSEAAKVKFDVDIDPWVYNIGIAYKF